eukprot:4321397-Prymnesium_polylepis.1
MLAGELSKGDGRILPKPPDLEPPRCPREHAVGSVLALVVVMIRTQSCVAHCESVPCDTVVAQKVGERQPVDAAHHRPLRMGDEARVALRHSQLLHAGCVTTHATEAIG